MLLNTQTITQYSGADAMVTTTNYHYINNSLPFAVESLASDGKTRRTEYTRVQDLTGITLPTAFREAVDTMLRRNMVAPVIEEKSIVLDFTQENRIQASLKKTTAYQVWGPAKK
ncbi:hypothetical protein [Paraflavitalea speifideaquila]|uniref:hypothetical protein n=1 Tax=Paraflavitalea speifideaquila TaxID=3076558 RepID=UPI0028EA4AD3|nr:hypothetical protein [Paraflavitalea speifideiaquila]